MGKRGEVVDIEWRKPLPAPAAKKAGALSKRWQVVQQAVRGSTNLYGAAFLTSGPCAGGLVAGGTGAGEIKVFCAADGGDLASMRPFGVYKVASGVRRACNAPLSAALTCWPAVGRLLPMRSGI